MNIKININNKLVNYLGDEIIIAVDKYQNTIKFDIDSTSINIDGMNITRFFILSKKSPEDYFN